MAKCGHCGKYTSAKGVIECYKCNNKYHMSCVVSAESAKFGSKWMCPMCKSKEGNMNLTSKNNDGDGTPTSSYDSSQSVGGSASREQVDGSIGHEFKMLRAEMRAMRDDLMLELREFRLEIADLRQTVATYRQKVDGLENRLDAITKQDSTSQIDHTIKELKTELNEREQELLLSDIEISNLPECQGENVVHTVELVARKLGIELDTRDIVFAERVGPRTGPAGNTNEPGGVGRGRRIVVRLARRRLRDDLLRSARTRRGATSEGLGFDTPPRRFYLNERLTRTYRQLFYRTRQIAANLNWRFTWTKHGRILTREGDGKQTFSIRSESDLERVFGKEALQATAK